MDIVQLQTFADAMPLPIVLLGPDERVIGLNRPALGLFGESALGRHYITALRNPVLLDCVEEALQQNRKRNATYLTVDMTRELTFDVAASPMPLPGGTGVILAFEDRTDREHAEVMRRDFVANVSHELKTPLTALSGFIETLQGPARGDAEAQARFLEIMSREADRMNRLVNDLLSLSRVEAQERVRPDRRLDVVELIGSTLEVLRPLAADNGVELKVDLPEKPIFLRADADQLVQVVNNLVENAIKYGGSGGEVSLTLTYAEREMAFRGAGVRIDVEDKGEGFDPVHISRLTERFYRLDNHRSREKGGTGLGLAIVKHIINRHRGRFRIESEPGQGSRFSVMLPVS